MSTEKPRYISNRELLLEIAKSKVSFCWFENPEKHARYDLIVQRLTDITPEVIEAAKAKRAAFLSTKAAPVAASSINTADLVFRVMTSEHIPEDPLRKRRGGDPNVPMVAKTNFPSFKHYMMKGKSLIEVGRSHWSGGAPPTGSFSLEQGKMTRRLADMLMLLVERYSLRANWRGYCVDETTEVLARVRGTSGDNAEMWITHDSLTTDHQVVSYDPTVGAMVWTDVLDVHRSHFDGKMYRMLGRDVDALVTLGHRWITARRGLVPIEQLRADDALIFAVSREVDSSKNGCITVSIDTIVDISDIDFCGAWDGARMGGPTESYKGTVWCPKTEFGSFYARRNGVAYLTGNTYVDEMKSHALLQLSQIALQFDESKSENPFAFYTTSIRNCFTRVLNLEKRNQHIRDDLLIMAGARPSYARQIADEEMQRAQAAVAERAQTPSDDSDAEGA